MSRFRETRRRAFGLPNYDVGVRCEPVARIVREEDPQATWRVLDVGSGTSGIAPYLRDWSVVGIDNRFGPHPRGLPLLQGSALFLPFVNQAFDAVTCIDVLEHVSVSQRPQLIAELLRVSRIRVLLAFPSGDNAREADRRTSAAFLAAGKTVPEWLEEHMENPYPDPQGVAEFVRQCPEAPRIRSLSWFFNESLALQKVHRFLARTTKHGYVACSAVCSLLLPLLARPIERGKSYRCVVSVTLG